MLSTLFAMAVMIVHLVSGQHYNPNAVHNCPEQCSCVFKRTYFGHVGDFDEVDVLCNRYSAQLSADLSVQPNISGAIIENRLVNIVIEQTEIVELWAYLFHGLRIKSLNIRNNLFLEYIDPMIIFDTAPYLGSLVILGNRNLEDAPLDAISECDKLEDLTIQVPDTINADYVTQQFSLFNMLSIKQLSLTGTVFRKSLPELEYAAGQLEKLTLNNMQLTGADLPSEIFKQLTKLEYLSLFGNNFTNIPFAALQLPEVKEISLEQNQIETPDSSMPLLRYASETLRRLNLRGNPGVTSIPCEAFNHAGLKHVYLTGKTICVHCETNEATLEARAHCEGPPLLNFPPEDYGSGEFYYYQ